MKITTQTIVGTLVAVATITVAALPSAAFAATPTAGYAIMPYNCETNEHAVTDEQTGAIVNQGSVICVSGKGYYRVVVRLYDSNTKKLVRVLYGTGKVVGSNERSTIVIPDGYVSFTTFERSVVPFATF
jgi:hypothetical protein